MGCEHPSLFLEPCSNADTVGYKRPTAKQRYSATLLSTPRTRKRGDEADAEAEAKSEAMKATFPGPLILPGDDLSEDPKYPAQSIRQWTRLKERNAVTRERNAIYIVEPPLEDDNVVELMKGWTHPGGVLKGKGKGKQIPRPAFDDVKDYVAAFYDGMAVKNLRAGSKLRFTTWDGEPASKRSKSSKASATRPIPPYIGLSTSQECIRIRSRPSSDNVFPAQLNLDDLLDAAISILPDDAYALLLLVDHDLYEDEDDLFVCGRAYGGSRVAVVSTARYHPALDAMHDVDRVHAWPASHCEAYVRGCCEKVDGSSKKSKRAKSNLRRTVDPAIMEESPTQVGPMAKAIHAHNSLPLLTPSSSHSNLTGAWLARICRTATHELGHCFGIDHCIYYACAMQGSSSLAEDARQPPYLCPVDLAKLLSATGATADSRYRALLAYCRRHSDSVHLFAAYEAWIEAQLLKGRLHRLPLTAMATSPSFVELSTSGST